MNYIYWWHNYKNINPARNKSHHPLKIELPFIKVLKAFGVYIKHFLYFQRYMSPFKKTSKVLQIFSQRHLVLMWLHGWGWGGVLTGWQARSLSQGDLMCLAQFRPIRFPCVQIPDRSLHTISRTQSPEACVCVRVFVQGGRRNCTDVWVSLCVNVNEMKRYRDKLYDINYSHLALLREKERLYGRVSCVSVPSSELIELNRTPTLPPIQLPRFTSRHSSLSTPLMFTLSPVMYGSNNNTCQHCILVLG